GQSAGMVKEKMTCAQLIQKLNNEAEYLLKGTKIHE
ncbi:MAG: enoyl-[acyl-carrier-protein] reductase FabK, partial [Coprococcus comes]|nr:enoyl-[acyl-carrier-protein] reductase FabK [Coprococcus comes]